jgi:hypothetical protein
MSAEAILSRVCPSEYGADYYDWLEMLEANLEYPEPSVDEINRMLAESC